MAKVIILYNSKEILLFYAITGSFLGSFSGVMI